MSDDDQVIRRLEALGHSDQELPTAERLASIEATLVGRIGLVERSPEGEFSLRRAAPVLLAVAALLILFVFAAAWFGGDASLTVQAADGSVVIELPDGRSVNASVGLDLPDGSFVDVAEGASVKLGDDLLGPGRYFVRDGRATPNLPIVDTPSSTTTTPLRVIEDNGPIEGDDVHPIDRTSPVPTSTAPVRPTTTVLVTPPPRTTLSDRASDTTLPAPPTTTTPVRRTTTSVGDLVNPTTTTTSTSIPTDSRRDGIVG